ncbi:MAG: ogr/Delta-like zinc finger family protein [Prevotella sp.]|nr:ogr/Delta-like zinc finger family protein [Prevotella sp.]
MTEKICPQCGKPMAKSSSRVESGEYIEVYICSDPNCGNVWHHKPKI